MSNKYYQQSYQEYQEAIRQQREKAAAYIKDVAPELYRFILAATIEAPDFWEQPLNIAHAACQNMPDLPRPLKLAILDLAEKLWSERPIGSAVGQIVNSTNSDFTINKSKG